MAKLYFRYGAMNSGKSTILMQVAHNYEERGMKVLLMKPGVDTKGDDKVVSRVGIERKVDHIILQNENIFDYYEEKVSDEVVCIIVDEVQFLKRHQVDELMQIVVNYDIPVICYGLRTDFMTNGFEGATRLLEIAHSIEEIKTICRCGSKAIFNARMVDGTPVFCGNQVEIDNNRKISYESMCPKCYYKKYGEKN